jgi:hypothetical protein
MNQSGQKVIAVDLDGTLAVAGPWQGPDVIGAPVPKMVERVKGWLTAGHEVRIFTSRLDTHGVHSSKIKDPIQAWCHRHIGRPLEVTNTKTIEMDECWDDRAVSVEENTGVAFDTDTSEKTLVGTGPAAALRNAATLYEQRNSVYKDNWKKAGACLNALFPDGMPPDQEILHLLSLAIVKISRFVNSDLKNEDSLDDLAVYAALMADIVKRRKEAAK